MSEAPRINSNHRRRGKRANLLVVGGVLAAMAVVLAFAARDVWTASEVEPPLVAKPQAAVDTQAEQTPVVAANSNVIDDDGESLWVSPTDGPPLNLAYLPPGVEVILALRPAKLLAHPEGRKVLAALGPRGAAAVDSLEQTAGASLHEIEQLLIGWQTTRDGTHLPTLVVRTTNSIEPPAGAFQPASGHGRLTVVAPESALEDIRALDGQAPPLARDMERLLSRTDSERDVVLLVQPRSLFGDRDFFSDDEFRPMRDQLEQLVGRDVSAAGLSLSWNESFFAELVVAPTLDSSPPRLSEQLASQVQAWPRVVEESVLARSASPYGRRVVARLPEMVRRLAAYTRHGYDRDAAILRCYLPVTAGHNLLMAGELALAEGQGGDATFAAHQPSPEAAASESIGDRLQKRTTLRFAREELEAALQMFAGDVGVPIEIRGQDLQLDGITRNQLFAIDLADRPAEEILVEILRRANPDKSATGPADPRQKLVYVLGPRGIIITTRSRAAARGEELPAAFRAE